MCIYTKGVHPVSISKSSTPVEAMLRVAFLCVGLMVLGEVANAQLVCPANSYAETMRISLEYTQATHSSIGWSISGHKIDDISNQFAWCAVQHVNTEWIEFDLGAVMFTVGVVVQGRGNIPTQRPTAFNVLTRETGAASNNVLRMSSTKSDTLKTSHLFGTPLNARHVRIVLTGNNDWPCARMAVLVRRCSLCIGSASSVSGSQSDDACQCPITQFKSRDAEDERAIALLLTSSQVSTRALRSDLVRFESTAPFAIAQGPAGGGGSIVLDKTNLQYMSGGSHAFNIATNGGFTAVVLARFRGIATNNEKIFDFAQSSNVDTIALWRSSGTTLSFEIRNANAATTCVVNLGAAIAQDSWMQIVATYVKTSNILRLDVGPTLTAQVTCPSDRTDRTIANTYLGRSNTAADPILLGNIAGLYAVDAALGATKIASIQSRMGSGSDVLQACEACPAGFTSGVGSVGSAACESMCPANAAHAPATTTCQCNAGFSLSGATCAACPAGTFKAAAGDGACTPCAAGTASATAALSTACPACLAGTVQPLQQQTSCSNCPAGTFKIGTNGLTCDPCPAGTASATTQRVAVCPPCPAGQIQTLAAQTACDNCPANHFRETASSASLATDCTPCPDFSTSLPGTTLETNCLCDAGYL